MSDLQRILLDARTGLVPWEPIPESRWAGIASRCGPDEIAEIHRRIAALQAELATVPAWDGDTQVDIHRTLELFRGILSLTGSA